MRHEEICGNALAHKLLDRDIDHATASSHSRSTNLAKHEQEVNNFVTLRVVSPYHVLVASHLNDESIGGRRGENPTRRSYVGLHDFGLAQLRVRFRLERRRLARQMHEQVMCLLSGELHELRDFATRTDIPWHTLGCRGTRTRNSH
jgi:hypothetical protein